MDPTEGTVHDERGNPNEDGVVLVVRDGQRYGAALAGQRVRVNTKELKNKSTMAACMTPEELAERVAKLKAKLEAKPKISQIAAAVLEGMALKAAERTGEQPAPTDSDDPAPVDEEDGHGEDELPAALQQPNASKQPQPSKKNKR